MPYTPPLISVIIPTYNRADLLPRAVRSACEQTYRNLEILVVDDASIDDTEEVARALEKEDARVRYVKREENGGANAARNIGIQESKGEYIALLDSDDEWLPEKIEKQIQVFEKSDDEKLGVVYCGYERKKDTATISSFTPIYRGNIFEKLLCKNVVGGCSSVLIKKECFGKSDFFDESEEIRKGGAQDYDLWLRLAHKYHFDFAIEPLFFYYIHKKNMTVTNSSLARMKALEYVAEKNKRFYLKKPHLFAKQLSMQGVTLIESGNRPAARKKFKHSLKIKYTNESLFRYIESFFPVFLHNKLKQIFNAIKR
jgi:glycosyltransferase involved in cell wall biosynthesis